MRPAGTASGNALAKALWHIESRLFCGLSLGEIARHAGLSPGHLCHAFAAATGQPVMHHLRARRLSEAARALAAGAPDILAVALAAGYGSHEAFTRAFRAQFGLTPAALRATPDLDSLGLVAPITLPGSLAADLAPPRLATGEALVIAGLGARYRFAANHGIPRQWGCFVPRIADIPERIGRVTYGVCCNGDEAGQFDYVAGVPVAGSARVPRDLRRLSIPRRRYAVFSHHGHISGIRATAHTIWNGWLPGAPVAIADAPAFERYDERFDPASGTGTVEIWLPLKD